MHCDSINEKVYPTTFDGENGFNCLIRACAFGNAIVRCTANYGHDYPLWHISHRAAADIAWNFMKRHPKTHWGRIWNKSWAYYLNCELFNWIKSALVFLSVKHSVCIFRTLFQGQLVSLPNVRLLSFIKEMKILEIIRHPTSGLFYQPRSGMVIMEGGVGVLVGTFR